MPAKANWLLLRGLSREAAHWGGFYIQMQAAFPNQQIYTLDLPGTGQYYHLQSPDTIPQITNYVRQSALEQGLLSKPLNIIALSLGGMVTWEWMLSYPADIQAAVLVNTSLAALSPFYARLRWQSYAKVLRILWQADVAARELAILELVSNWPDHYPAIQQQWLNIQLKRPVSLANSLRQIRAAASYHPPEQKPTQSVLLLNSAVDRLVDPSCSIAIHNKWNLDLLQHPWAGHDLSLDDPLWVLNQIRNKY